MAKIKHIAIVTMDPEKMAQFYAEVFEMEVVSRSRSGATFMSDGYITLALLPNGAVGKPNGLNHFGFEIDDQDEYARRIEAFGLKGPVKRPDDRPYAETRVCDPEGNNIDLSVNGFEVIRPDRVDSKIVEMVDD
ncbi:MAG: VOC family protein [Rhodospirillaceae bacterium]